MRLSIFQIVLLFIFGLVAILGILTFAGYLDFFQDEPPGTGEEVVVWGTFPKNKALTDFFSDFNGAEGVSINYQAKSSLTFETELINALATGRGPDLFILPSDLIISYRDKVYPIPFASYPLKNFQANFIDAASSYLTDSAALGLPVGIDPLVLYYNQDLFSAGGLSLPPATWEEFVSHAENLTKADQTGVVSQSGAALGSFANVRNSVLIYSALVNQGGRSLVYRGEGSQFVVSLSNRGGFDNTAAVTNALDFFLQFSDPALATYSWNASLPNSRDFFTAGSLAMYFGLASEDQSLSAANPHLNFTVAVFPQLSAGRRATAGRLYGLALSRNTTKRDAAFLALGEITRADRALPLAQALGLVPVRRDLLAKPPDDLKNDIFYRSAIIAQVFLDPNPDYSGVIFVDLGRKLISGLSNVNTALRETEEKLNLLIR